MHTRPIDAGNGLSFQAWIGGPPDGELVVLLHGFPQSRHSWRHQLPALEAAGYRTVAFDQRGYSPGARPDPGVPVRPANSPYHLDRLVGDVLDVVDALGPAGRPFHLVGHDWGGMVAWTTAFRHPDRVASLAVLSRPHPLAFAAALDDDNGDQRHRSRHHRSFLDPDTGNRLLENDARRLRRLLRDGRVPQRTIDDYVSVIGTVGAMDAALAWYRALPGLAAPVGPIQVPTLYVWGDEDPSVGRAAAEGTGAHVEGAFRFVELTGVGHFASDEQPDMVAGLLLQHLNGLAR